MPKRILLIAFAVTALALAACNSGYNPEDLYGTPAPTSTASTPTPNPSAAAAQVAVYVSSSPIPNQPVNLYTDVNGHYGTLITTQVTDATGSTTFSNLTPATNYCFNTSYTPSAPGSTAQNQWICGYLWFEGVVFSF